MGVLKANVNGEWVPVEVIAPGGPVPPGGATGQVLTKRSNTNYDVRWAGQSVRQYKADTMWRDVGGGETPFQNSWVNYGGGFNGAGYRIDAEGWVYLKGLVRNGAHGTPIFTLPPAYRPWKIVFFPAVCNPGNNGYVQVNTDGTVVAYVYGDTQWFSLETSRFPVWNAWSQFTGKYIPLDGQELRVVPNSEYHIGLWPQTNGMIRIMGIAGPLPAAGTVWTYLNDINRSWFTYIFGVATDNAVGGRAIQISKRYGFYSNGPAGTSWTMISAEYGSMACEDKWIAPTLENGWANVAPNTQNWHVPAGYWKDDAGVVHLRGFLVGPNVNAAMFTLPVGYRPAGQVLWFGGSAAAATCRIDVATDGKIYPGSGSSTGWTALDGINFYAADA
jgi:hypothetical protein